MSLALVAVVTLLQCLSVEVWSSEVTVGDDNWYNNNNTLLVEQSMTLADKLQQQINNNQQQQQQQQPSLYSGDSPKLKCEPDFRPCVPILVQQNIDGSKFFNRSWKEFRAGFSGSNGNYWIGNELLHQLTKNGRYKLRVDMQLKSNNAWLWAEYNTFTVYDEDTQYDMHVASYIGNTGYDALAYHDRMKFTTYDRDNDPHPSANCASACQFGWWYNYCYHVSINGSFGTAFYWYHPSGILHLKASRMWLLCR